MEIHMLAELLNHYSPAHFNGICVSLDLLSDELVRTKEALSKDLMTAQNQDNYTMARVILDIQEELSQKIAMIQKLLSEYRTEESESNEDICSKERLNYSLYGMDDTVAYDIEDTPVTFKRPAAFSYNGKRYPVTKWKTLFAKICELLYSENPLILRSMVNESRQPGKRQVKMSTSKADIRSPVRIADSDIWLETNRDADDTRRCILVLLDRYSIPYDSVKVYFKRDYAALH